VRSGCAVALNLRLKGVPPGKGKLAPYRAFFEELVAQDPDITLFELRDALMAAEDVQVHHSSIAALLSRLGFTFKKNRWWPPSAAAPR
jgi:transposase